MQAPRPSAIIYDQGNGSSLLPVKQNVVAQAIPIAHIDGKTAEDTTSLVRVITQIKEVLRVAYNLAASNPLASSVIRRDVVMNHNVTTVLNHGLGAPVRFEVFNVRPLPPTTTSAFATLSFIAPNPQPATVNPNNQIAILPRFSSSGAAVVDVRFTV